MKVKDVDVTSRATYKKKTWEIIKKRYPNVTYSMVSRTIDGITNNIINHLFENRPIAIYRYIVIRPIGSGYLLKYLRKVNLSTYKKYKAIIKARKKHIKESNKRKLCMK